MAAQLLDLLTEQSQQLTDDEQLMLAMRLIERVRQGAHTQPESQKLRWRNLRGALPYPATGEDAQAWVTRTRREGDQRRDIR